VDYIVLIVGLVPVQYKHLVPARGGAPSSPDGARWTWQTLQGFGLITNNVVAQIIYGELTGSVIEEDELERRNG
jgi:hypothetical protein